MKLFTKIFLQVICMVLLLSSGIFFYTTYRWKNQSIQNINSYENSRFQTNISKFENMLMRIKSKTQDTDDKIREKMIIYAFRQVFTTVPFYIRMEKNNIMGQNMSLICKISET